MPGSLNRLLWLGSAAFALALPMLAQTPARPAARPAGIPRMSDGKPNLNGLWQSMNAANWDVEDHSAQAGAVVAAGAWGAEPAGFGIIDGSSTIPYRPEVLQQREQNFRNRAKQDPEVKCYLPGIPRANYMPYPFEIVETGGD